MSNLQTYCDFKLDVPFRYKQTIPTCNKTKYLYYARIILLIQRNMCKW